MGRVKLILWTLVLVLLVGIVTADDGGDVFPPSAPCNCTGPDLNCSDFASGAAAQACYEYCKQQGYGDVFRLDGDSDGSACESLP